MLAREDDIGQELKIIMDNKLKNVKTSADDPPKI